MLTQMLLSATVWAPQGLITSPHKGLQRKGGAPGEKRFIGHFRKNKKCQDS